MSDKELGRPSYKAASAPTPSSASARQPQPKQQRRGDATGSNPKAGPKPGAGTDAGTDAGRRSRKARGTQGPSTPVPGPWSEPATLEPPVRPGLPKKPKAARKPDAAKKKAKSKDDLPPEAARVVYVPAKASRGAGYALWAVIRSIVLVIAKVVLTMVKVALSPFHAMGVGRD